MHKFAKNFSQILTQISMFIAYTMHLDIDYV